MKNIISINVAFSLSFLKFCTASVAVEQIYPDENVPICLGSIVTYRCTTSGFGGGQLIWQYTTGDLLIGFFADSTDSIGQILTFGNFEVVLESIDQDGSNYTLISNVTSANGLTIADNEQVLSCNRGSVSEKVIIFFADPIISEVSVGVSTIFWIPPPCTANCTVIINGKDITTISCSKGFLSSSIPDLCEKSVLITAIDELSNSKNISSSGHGIPCPSTMETDVTLFPSTMDTFGLSKNFTSTSALLCGPVFIEHVYNIVDQVGGRPLKILGQDTSVEIEYNINDTQLTFTGECGETYQIVAGATVVAIVDPLDCNESVNHAACGLLISFVLLLLFDTMVVVFGVIIWVKKKDELKVTANLPSTARTLEEPRPVERAEMIGIQQEAAQETASIRIHYNGCSIHSETSSIQERRTVQSHIPLHTI